MTSTWYLAISYVIFVLLKRRRKKNDEIRYLVHCFIIFLLFLLDFFSSRAHINNGRSKEPPNILRRNTLRKKKYEQKVYKTFNYVVHHIVIYQSFIWTEASHSVKIQEHKRLNTRYLTPLQMKKKSFFSYTMLWHWHNSHLLFFSHRYKSIENIKVEVSSTGRER